MKKLILASIITAFASTSFADTMTDVDYKNWTAVPITVEGDSYTVRENVVIPADNYYYSYEGYRCFKNQMKDMKGEKKLTLKTTTDASTGATTTTSTTTTTNSNMGAGTVSEIYCYTE